MSFDPDMDSSFSATQHTAEPRNHVRFYQKWKRNNFKSEQEGREVGEYVDYALIICPGQAKSEVHMVANDELKRLHRQEWEAYKEGREQRAQGTPIETLPGLPSGMADALKSLYIFTIEQMAELSDSSIQKVGLGGNEIRQKCKAYLEKSSVEAAGLKERIAALEEENAVLKRTVHELKEALGGTRPRSKKAA